MSQVTQVSDENKMAGWVVDALYSIYIYIVYIHVYTLD